MPTPTHREHGSPPWMAVLMKAYSIIDQAAKAGLEAMSLARASRPACTPGCAHCCRGVIPASAPELAGAFLHVAANCCGKDRLRIASRLTSRPLGECPFLLDGKCAVYPVRFFACRQFFMFGPACSPNENTWATRPADIPRPDHAQKLRAFALLTSLYGQAVSACDAAFLERFIRDVSAPLHLWNLERPDAIVADLAAGRLHYAAARETCQPVPDRNFNKVKYARRLCTAA